MTSNSSPVYPHKLRRLYWPFLALAETCRFIVGTVAGSFRFAENRYTIPRFTVLGPPSPMQKRIGVFGLLHGDEAASSLTLLRLLQSLVADPTLATGYDLVLYPVCNPTGYEDDTRHNRNGADLNREFWQGSRQPEVHILEEEIRSQNFDDVIVLRSGNSRAGCCGYAHGPVLNENLLLPALQAASAVLPAHAQPRIAPLGLVEGSRSSIGVVSTDQKPRPFEIIFETPAWALLEKQTKAAHLALLSILKNYRRFIAYAQDL